MVDDPAPFIIRGPLPDRGPPVGLQDGSTPGLVWSAGNWVIVGGVLVNVPTPSGFVVK